jgi:alanine racemase
MWQAEARVDLDAIRQNVTRLGQGTSAELMAVVKADGYGHGMVPAARAALDAGATWLGVCTLDEALTLREAGITAPVLAWLLTPGLELHRAIAGDVDLSVAGTGLLDEVVAAARQVSRPARLHLKVDTGLTRGGATVADWPALLEAAAKAQADGTVEIVGVWSHFAYADAPGHPTITRQIAVFQEALEVAERLGVRPAYRHLANSAATLTLPAAHFDLVRPGIAVYGLSPIQGTTAEYGLRPAMTLRARVMLAKRVPEGSGVSYGHAYTTPRETTVAVIPLGYADGIARAAGNTGPLLLGGKRRRIAGRVCMDQFVVDVGDDAITAGDVATIFGPGEHGEPTADDWAEVLDTISYEVVTRIGPRVPRVYDGEVKVDAGEQSETGT